MKKLQKRVNKGPIYASFERSRVTALLGARRVGKTTLLLAYMANFPGRKWVFLNMDKRDERLRVEKGELEQVIEEQALRRIGQGDKIWVAIDEAQKSPALFDQVKALYDATKDQDKLKFILTGSGHLNLHQLASESLAGRVELMHLREFNLKEMVELLHPEVEVPGNSIWHLLTQDVDEQALHAACGQRRPFKKLLTEELCTHLIWGGLPEVLEEESSEGRQRYLANYLQTYLENDVRAIETISDLGLYQQLMKACAEQTGSLRDDQRLINALACARNTLIKYRGYMTATMQYKELYPYINSTVKRLVKSPKGYLINNGLVSYLTGVQDFSVLCSTGLVGHRFENWLLNELLTFSDVVVASHALYFWRTSSGSEVDFVVSVGANLLPIEVTFSAQKLPKKTRHLTEFLKAEPKAKWGVYLYTGDFAIDAKQRIIYLPAWLV